MSDLTAPVDKYNFVYMVMLLLGIGSVLPWNMFINANDYFVNYKLPESNSTEINSYRNHFLSYLGVFAIGPNFLLQLLNLINQTGFGPLKLRITISTIIEIFIFIVTILLAIVDSSGWQAAFFFTTMATVVVLNMAAGIFQNSTYGVAAKLPMTYTNGIVIGMNFSGTFAALAGIISIAVSSGPKPAAIIYFTSALIFLLCLLSVYWLLYSNEYYLHFNAAEPNEEESKLEAKPDAAAISPGKLTLSEKLSLYKKVFTKCWMQCLNTFLVFFASLAVFPAVQANVRPMNHIISDTYFIPVTVFLTFNLFAMIGNICASEKLPKMGPKYLWIPITLRLLFIPFFLYCNYLPGGSRQWPVAFDDDVVFWVGSVFLGFTSGYFSSLTMMYAPKTVEPEYAQIAGMMAGFFLIFGIFAGVSITFAWGPLVS